MGSTRRSEIVIESINRLCRANKIDKEIEGNCSEDISHMISNRPNLSNSGSEVKLYVTNTHLKIISKETEEVLIQHEMPNISYASSNDNNTGDFVAYVAKDEKYGRACFVLEYTHGTAKDALNTIASAFKLRSNMAKTLPRVSTDKFTFSNTMYLVNSTPVSTSEPPQRNCKTENTRNESVVTLARALLEKEPWYHGTILNRDQSETRLKEDGDFLVRESTIEPGQFVLSVMHDGTILHLLFDSIGQVRTKDMEFKNINHLVKFHHDEGLPILAENREVYLRKGITPQIRSNFKIEPFT